MAPSANTTASTRDVVGPGRSATLLASQAAPTRPKPLTIENASMLNAPSDADPVDAAISTAAASAPQGRRAVPRPTQNG